MGDPHGERNHNVEISPHPHPMKLKCSYFLIAAKIIKAVDILGPQTGLYTMDSMAPSPLPFAEGTLVEEAEEAEGGLGKPGGFLELWQGAGTDRHRTSSSTARPTHALAPPACCTGLRKPSLLEPGPGTGSCTHRGQT